jgi:hypothetical protein
LAPESDAPQRRRTRGQRGQGGARVSVVQPVLPVSGHVSRAAESVPDLMSRLTHPPPPLGFERNIGRNYVPCLIPLEGGRQVPATYVRVVMSINPQVIGRRDGDEAEYGGLYTLNLTSVQKPLAMLLTTWGNSRLTHQKWKRLTMH